MTRMRAPRHRTLHQASSVATGVGVEGRRLRAVLALAAVALMSGCSGAEQKKTGPPRPYQLAGPLIPATTTMVSAWDIPADPTADPSLDGGRDAGTIRLGFRLFMNTPAETSRFVHNALSCNNCHLNAGQREKALPLVGVAAAFPEYNKRAGRTFTLEDRIVGCFMRSENAAAETIIPSPKSEEVVALAAYLTWLSRDYKDARNLPWRGQNTIPKSALIPVEELRPARGEALFADKCVSCHGTDGQGVQIGDKKAGPLWGPGSWNDGAGAARVYTLAGIIRYAMPYLDPGSLTDEEAQQIAAFITSKPRPVYPFKADDYRKEPMPPDAVYYRR
jgi:thiosulfate dehydrogenase